MSGLIIRRITSNPGSNLELEKKPFFKAYNKFGRWVLHKKANFRDELRVATLPIVIPPNPPIQPNPLDFLATRLRGKKVDDPTIDSGEPRLLIQHSPDADLPARDVQADITAYHKLRKLVIADEDDQAGTAKSVVVFPDMRGAASDDTDVSYLLSTLAMVMSKIDDGPDDFLRAYFGAMLVAKCR